MAETGWDLRGPAIPRIPSHPPGLPRPGRGERGLPGRKEAGAGECPVTPVLSPHCSQTHPSCPRIVASLHTFPSHASSGPVLLPVTPVLSPTLIPVLLPHFQSLLPCP